MGSYLLPIAFAMVVVASSLDTMSELPACVYTAEVCFAKLQHSSGFQGSLGIHLIQHAAVNVQRRVATDKEHSFKTSVASKQHALDGPGDVDDPNKIRILHIGKTAGMTLEGGLDEALDHQKAMFLGHVESERYINETYLQNIQDRPSRKNLVFFVRSPVHRFTSAWLSRYGEGKPDCYAPWRPEERWAFERFHTPDELACALSSSDQSTASDAKRAMMSISHVSRDIAWYLDGLQTLHRFTDSILFVGRTEHFDDDYTKLVNILRHHGALIVDPWKYPETKHATLEKNEKLKWLGRCAVLNLHKWYHEDYAIIAYLADKGLIDAAYPNEVESLDAEPPSGEQRKYLEAR